MLRFQEEEYRAPLSLHTHRKVAQKDPIFPPKVNPNLPFNTTTRCKRNINLSSTQELTISIFLYFGKFTFLSLFMGRGGTDVVFSLHTSRKSVKNPHLFLLLTHSNDYSYTYHQYKK